MPPFSSPVTRARSVRSARSLTPESIRQRRRARLARRLVLAVTAAVMLLGAASLAAGKWRATVPAGPATLAGGRAEQSRAAVAGVRAGLAGARRYLDRAVTTEGRVARPKGRTPGGDSGGGGAPGIPADRAGGHRHGPGTPAGGGGAGRGGATVTGASGGAAGDTSSGDQAHALLLAVAVGDRERFDRLWDWARTHLRRPDGLLARRWSASEGKVVDPEADAGADVDTAHALVLASRRFTQPRYLLHAARLSRAILAHETVRGPDRRPVLVAGPRSTRAPMWTINPGDISPVAYEQLARATGDDRWRQLRETGLAHLRQLTRGGRVLPPDWARLRPDGTVRAVRGPGEARIRYGDEAARVLPHLAGACVGDAPDLAGALWRPVARTVVERAASHHLDGEPERPGTNLRLLVAGAAAAQAAGHLERRAELLEEVDRRAAGRGSAAGPGDLDAWLLVGRLLLEGSALGGCPGTPV